MTALDDLRQAAELLPAGASVTLTREALLAAIGTGRDETTQVLRDELTVTDLADTQFQHAAPVRYGAGSRSGGSQAPTNYGAGTGAFRSRPSTPSARTNADVRASRPMISARGGGARARGPTPPMFAVRPVPMGRESGTKATEIQSNPEHRRER